MTTYAWRAHSGEPWIEIARETEIEMELNGEEGVWGITPQALDAWSPQRRTAAGFKAIQEVARPDDPWLRVTGSNLGSGDGPVRTWEADELSVGEVKEILFERVSREYDARRVTPMAWNFGLIDALDDHGSSLGAAGEQTLQMRESPWDDLKNWLAVAAGAGAAKQAGAGGTVLPLKVTSNAWVQTTADDVVQVLISGDGSQLSALQRGMAMRQRFGAIKSSIEAASTKAALNAVRAQIVEGWPD